MKILPNTIICFHEIKSQELLNYAFESLKKNYYIIGMEELEDYYYNNKDLKNSCHITFDDGDMSFYNNALPIIKKHKIRVSTYVSPLVAKEYKNFWFQEIVGYNVEKLFKIIKKVTNIKSGDFQPGEVKKILKTLQLEVIWEIIKLYQLETQTQAKPPMNMTDKHLIELKSSGLVEIGAHTLHHPILTNETIAFATNEITGSIDQLSDILNHETKYFVYPNGAYGDREIEILKDKGIRLAFTSNRDKISRSNNPLCIPRSGSPFISELRNNDAYIFSKCFVQLLAGEKRYYKYANTWSSMVSKVLK
jgi:peptidoglycan/xylan/chitin deacetylase (PgdA/CDA1 family)